MSGPGYVFVPHDALVKIATSPDGVGGIGLRHVPSENFYVVHMVETAPQVRQQVVIPKQYTALRWGDAGFEGRWVRRPSSELNILHVDLLRRPGSAVPYATFRELMGVTLDPGAQAMLVITYDPDVTEQLRAVGVEEYAGWFLTREGAAPFPIAVEPAVTGMQQLADRWPLEDLSTLSVAVVGCGSVGGVAADTLAGYGVGSLYLVDDDRFLWHNMVRHLLGPESVGRNKAIALADNLSKRWGNDRILSIPLDVVRQADVFRALVRNVDLVVCTADGVAPRRVVSHAARRAGTPAILACVLDHGAVGEVLRLRPTPRYGCLLCLRASLAKSGAMDAEADQELAYGTGSAHQPMTAVPSDLRLVGVLAAKLATATLLESRVGDGTQQLPGEHAIIGLRPGGDLAAPFDLQHASDIRWSSIPPPREKCPTCAP